jgi:hypothetical protein
MMPPTFTLHTMLRNVSSVLRSVLQEIFDESAYDRFLMRRELQSSRQAYAEFQRESEVSRQRRPRCC